MTQLMEEKPYRIFLTEDEIISIIRLFMLYGSEKMAKKVAEQFDAQEKQRQTSARLKALREQSEAERAAAHELTYRQAEMLLARHHGYSLHTTFYKYVTREGPTAWKVGYLNGAGGARRRMASTLQRAGLLSRDGMAQITEAGKRKLDAYIEAHPNAFPKLDDV